MSGNALIPLMGEPVQFGQSANQGIVAANNLYNLQENRRTEPMRMEALKAETDTLKTSAEHGKKLAQLQSAAIDTAPIYGMLGSGNVPGAIAGMEVRNNRLLAEGRDNTHTQRALDALRSGDPAQIQSVSDELLNIQQTALLYGGGSAGGASSAQREFESLTSGMSPEQIEEARRIKLGLAPRAVGSAPITIALGGLTAPVAASEGAIAGAKAGASTSAENFADMGGYGGPTAADVAESVKRAQDQATVDVKKETSAPVDIATGVQLIGLLDIALKHPGREAATGTSSIFNPVAIPGTDRKDFLVLASQLKGNAFLQAYSNLKGGGPITDIEGQKATEAQNRLNEAQSEPEYVRALEEMKTLTSERVDRAKQYLGGATPQNGQAGGQIPEGQTAVNPATGQRIVFRGGQWVSQ